MKASVIIPAFNAEKTIEKCIQSVLNQTVKPLEIIAINDGSTDKTSEILKKFGKKIRITELKKNSGAAAARNAGIKETKGEIVAFTDSDCIADKNWLKELLNGFKNEKIGLVQGKILTDKTDSIFFHFNKSTLKGKVQNSNVAYRKKAVESAGFFDENFKRFRDDTDLMLRVQNNGWLLEFNPQAIVFHPAYKRSFFGIVKFQNRYFTDALYHKKHPAHFRENELSQEKFYLSQIFCFRTINVFIIALIILTYINWILGAGFLVACYAISVLFGLFWAFRERKNTNAIDLIQLVFLTFMVFFATWFWIWKGIIEFKKLML